METTIEIEQNISTNLDKCLSDKEKQILEEQNKRRVPEFKANQLENLAKKHWDLFYKRNETKFFKDRHWTTREFEELLNVEEEKSLNDNSQESSSSPRKLLEVGCGVGNFIYPLIEDDVQKKNRMSYYYYACDFSPRAVDFVRSNALYNEEYVKAFQCDITTEQLFENIEENSLDIVTMIFVLSAIHPDKFQRVIENIYKVLRPGGIVLFRDYGIYDMAQFRFKAGHKISENFYMRQDGTRSYYFSTDELGDLFKKCNFKILSNSYVQRRTINIKEGIDVPRIFLQGKFRKEHPSFQ